MASGAKKDYSIVIPSELSELARVEEFTERAAVDAGIEEDERDNLAIAVTEVVNNAIIHGNRRDKKKKVTVDIAVSGRLVTIKVKDEGKGFNPSKLADPLKPENLLKESGRGIYILRAIMDSVEFDFSNGGTTTIMKKKL